MRLEGLLRPYCEGLAGRAQASPRGCHDVNPPLLQGCHVVSWLVGHLKGVGYYLGGNGESLKDFKEPRYIM